MFNQKQLMGQLKKMQDEMVKIQEELQHERVEGKAGENKVTITMNGHFEVQSIKIDPGLLVPDDAEMLEDLLVLGFRDAAEKAKNLSAQRLGPFAGNLKIPGF